MSSTYDQLKSRNAALAALVLLAIICVAAVAFLLSTLFRVAEGDTTNELRELTFYRAEIAGRSSADADLKESLRRAATSPGLIQASSTALAQAQLETEIKKIAADNGAEIHSTDILPVAKDRDFEVVALQDDLSVPMSRLRDLTYAIETHTPYYFIGSTTITTAPGWQPNDAVARDPPLQIRWTIKAYRWAGKR